MEWKLHSSGPEAWEPVNPGAFQSPPLTIGGGVDPEHGYVPGAFVDFRYRWGMGECPQGEITSQVYSDWTQTLDVELWHG